MSSTCQAIKEDGTRCSNPARAGHKVCWFHNPDPEVVEKRKEARKRGGVNRWQKKRIQESTASDSRGDAVVEFLFDALEEIKKPNIAPHEVARLKAAGYLCSILLRAIETVVIASRVEALETTLARSR